jgi:hypothetical protein
MRTLRGDLFEITDEDPLELAVDEEAPSDPFVAAPADELYLDEPQPRVPSPAARHPGRLGSRRGRWVLFAAFICAAAAGVVALGASESAQRGSDDHATSDARVSDPPLRRSSSQPPRSQQRDRRHARRELIRESPPGDVVATSTADAAPDAEPGPPMGAMAEPVIEPNAVEHEFGFER